MYKFTFCSHQWNPFENKGSNSSAVQSSRPIQNPHGNFHVNVINMKRFKLLQVVIWNRGNICEEIHIFLLLCIFICPEGIVFTAQASSMFKTKMAPTQEPILLHFKSLLCDFNYPSGQRCELKEINVELVFDIGEKQKKNLYEGAEKLQDTSGVVARQPPPQSVSDIWTRKMKFPRGEWAF